MLERRHSSIQRAINGGILLGATSVFLLAATEAIYVLCSSADAFTDPLQMAGFGGLLVLTLVGMGSVVGALQGIVVLAGSATAKGLAKRRVAEPRWLAGVFSVILAPAIAIVAATAFSGSDGSRSGSQHVFALVGGALGLAVAYGLLRLFVAARDLFRLRRWGPTQGRLFVFLAIAAAAGIYFSAHELDRDRSATVALAVLSLVFFQVAVTAVYAAWRPTARWMGRLLEPSAVLILAVALTAGGAWSLSRTIQSDNLWQIARERTVVQKQVLALLERVHIVPPASAAQKKSQDR